MYKKKGVKLESKKKKPRTTTNSQEKNQQLNWNSTEKRQCGCFWFSKFESLGM